MLHRCIFPCSRSFASDTQLVNHYSRKRDCNERWVKRRTMVEQLALRNAAKRRQTRAQESSKEDNGAKPFPEHHFDEYGDQNPMDQGSVEGDVPSSNLVDAHTRTDSQQLDGEDAPDIDAHTRTDSQQLEGGDTPDIHANNSLDNILTFDDFLFPPPGVDGDGGDRHPYAEPNESSDTEEDGPFLGDPIAEGAQPVSDHDHHNLEGDDESTRGINPGPDLLDEFTDGVIETYPRSGEIKTHSDPHFDRLLKKQMLNGTNPYTPFRGLAEFELATWLNELPLSRVDSFLRLQWVRFSLLSLPCLMVCAQVKGAGGTSFGSCKAMREQIGKLPKPRMTWENIEVIPRSGTTTSPVFLCYRDPVEAIRHLLDRPSLRNHLTYSPQRHWKDIVGGSRQYTEIMTGDWAWETQVSTEMKNRFALTG